MEVQQKQWLPESFIEHLVCARPYAAGFYPVFTLRSAHCSHELVFSSYVLRTKDLRVDDIKILFVQPKERKEKSCIISKVYYISKQKKGLNMRTY